MSFHPTINIRLQTCRRFLAEWAGALSPMPPIYQSRNEGGAGVLSANSAALFRLWLMDRDQQVRLHHSFNEWLEDQAQRRQQPPFNWTLEETVENLSRSRKIMTFGFVYRDLERTVGVAAVNECLGAAALWSFGEMARLEQYKVIAHVEKRHAEQCEIDEQAVDALQRIYGYRAAA